MRVLLTSAGLETEKIKRCFIELVGKDMACVAALFIPTAAIDADAVEVLPKCMNDLLKCGIQKKNIKVYDLHTGMEPDELRKYDVVYLCGGNASYLLDRVNATGFNRTLTEYIAEDGVVLGVSAGSLLFAGNLSGNLGLLPAKLRVHCPEGEDVGKLSFPLKEKVKLTNTCALLIRQIPDGIEIIGE